jgi:hypothetical protein
VKIICVTRRKDARSFPAYSKNYIFILPAALRVEVEYVRPEYMRAFSRTLSVERCLA